MLPIRGDADPQNARDAEQHQHRHEHPQRKRNPTPTAPKLATYNTTQTRATAIQNAMPGLLPSDAMPQFYPGGRMAGNRFRATRSNYCGLHQAILVREIAVA